MDEWIRNTVKKIQEVDLKIKEQKPKENTFQHPELENKDIPIIKSEKYSKKRILYTKVSIKKMFDYFIDAVDDSDLEYIAKKLWGWKMQKNINTCPNCKAAGTKNIRRTNISFKYFCRACRNYVMDENRIPIPIIEEEEI